MADFLATVTDAQSRLVHTVRSLQKPMVGYVRRGVEFADSRLPDMPYPSSLPSPAMVIDSQFNFAKDMLDAHHDLARALVDTMSPMVGSSGRRSRGSSSRATRPNSSRPAAGA